VRSLPRGTLVRAADVGLCRAVPREAGAEVFYSIDEVVGQETTEAIAKDKILQAKQLSSPLLVRRGEVVTVCARSAGIRVRTSGRARDSGSLGDLVAVESLVNRQTYYARVTKLREVEVYARSAKADQAEVGGEADAVPGGPGCLTRKGAESEAAIY
jgi:flagella basal body P-ring formation protein FlgA